MEFGDDYFVTGGKNGSLHAIVFKSSNTVGSKRKSFVRIINI